MTKEIRLTFQHPKDNWDEFLGVKLDESSYDLLIEEDADVYTPEGDLLLRFRKKCLDPRLAAVAFKELVKIKGKTENRGMASGKIYMKEKHRTKADGTKSRTNRVMKGGEVISSIIGYFDRYPRIPYCRQTAFNANNGAIFDGQILPFLREVDRKYAAIDPDRYALQRRIADATSQDFVIKGTSYTTITVNQNFQTAVHTDQGDLKDGLSNILVLRSGEFRGGNLVFPHYRAAVRLDTCDLLLFDSHHMHGNTPIFGSPGKYKRVSLVCYYRERMQDCGSASEELERAKNRKLGDPLYGAI